MTLRRRGSPVTKAVLCSATLRRHNLPDQHGLQICLHNLTSLSAVLRVQVLHVQVSLRPVHAFQLSRRRCAPGDCDALCCGTFAQDLIH